MNANPTFASQIPRVPCLGFLVLLALALIAQGCGWDRTMTFPSPSGKAVVEIWQPPIENSWGVRVDLVRSGGRTLLFEGHRDEFLYFVHVYWSPDETTVGVLVRGLARLDIAYDSVALKQIPFAEIRNDLGDSIKRSYSLPQALDPFDWADTTEGQCAFFARHPEFKVTYYSSQSRQCPQATNR